MFNRRSAAATAMTLLSVVAGFASTATASAAVPQPLPPAQAAAFAGATAAVQSGTATRSVSAQEALAAAAISGATVFVAPGLSLAQAVGIAPAASITTTVAPVVRPVVDAAESVGCAASSAWHEWGTWPYQQRITDTTYWCAVPGDHITYRSSSVTASGLLCSTSWTSSQLISGGIGYSWFVMRSSAGWSCATAVPWITLHPSHYLDVSRNAWGNSAEVGSS